MKHKHHDLIVAWAADTSRKVQCRRPRGQWTTLDETPIWDPGFEYRFADSVLRYRVALFDNGAQRWTTTTDSPTTAANWEETKGFIRWITDWIEVTEPVVEEPKPKMKKYERWLNLYNNGTFGTHATLADAETYAGIDHVECRRIEWEVPA